MSRWKMWPGILVGEPDPVEPHEAALAAVEKVYEKHRRELERELRALNAQSGDGR